MSPQPGPIVPRNLTVAQSVRTDVALGVPYATDLSFLPLRAALTTRMPEQSRIDAAEGDTSEWRRRQAVALARHVLGVPAGWHGVVGRDLCLAAVAALLPVRRRGGAVVYLSEQANPHIVQAVDVLGVPCVVVTADRYGSMDTEQLVAVLRRHPGGPAVIVATVGTQLTEGVDDLAAIAAGLHSVGMTDRYLHVDAPLAGLPRLLLDPGWAERLWSIADSVVFAGHTFLGTPADTTLMFHREQHQVGLDCGDDGQPALMLWYALDEFGAEGLARRARQSRGLGSYALRRLQDLGWPAWRNADAFTVVLRPPSAAVLQRWSMRVQRGWTRIVCMPGATEAHIDRFIADLAREPPPVHRSAAAGTQAPTGTQPRTGTNTALARGGSDANQARPADQCHTSMGDAA